MPLLAMLAAAAAHTPEGPKTILDGYMTFAGLILLVGLAASWYTILRAVRTTRRENEADLLAKLDPVRGDVRELQTVVADFMPRSEIEARDTDVRHLADKAGRDVAELREKYARLDERQQSLAGDVSEIKTLVKEQGRDTAARLDRMNDCLTTISRKVG